MRKINIIYPKDVLFECESSVAYESFDHIHPKGAKGDNSTNWLFNRKFYRLYFPKYLKVLDLGCSGGGFVRECINDGCFGIGLEGSDYSKRMNRAEWPIISESLYTCDITKNFSIYNKDKKIIKFNLITAWEVLEHLEENQIDSFIKNVKKHLSEDGIFVVSVANYSDKIGDIEYHRTQKNKKWWVNKFLKNGFFENKKLYSYFNGQYIRGVREAEWGFHLIMCLNPEKTPNPPKLGFKEKLIDMWTKSKIRVIIQRYIIR